MKGFEYVKVILYAFPKLEMLSEAISSGVEVKAALSFRAKCGALETAEKIAEEMAKRARLDRLRADTEEVLKVLSDEERFLLEYKYFRRRRVLAERYPKRYCRSEREYFRRQNAGLKKIGFLIAARGWTEEEFFRAFGRYAPFLRAYRAVSEGREQSVAGMRRKRQISFSGARQNSERSSSGSGGDLRLPRRINAAAATTATARMQSAAICPAERGAVCSCGGSAFPELGER